MSRFSSRRDHSPESRTRADAPERRVCLVADDFGLRAGVDAAIIDLVASRRLQALGCMTGGRSWSASAPGLLTTTFEQTDLGLHLDLSECPIGRAPERLGRLIVQAYTHQLDRESVRLEIRLQLSAFEDALGQPPDYVDGHQHVHQLPQIRDLLLDELTERYPADRRPWLRSTRTAPAQRSSVASGTRNTPRSPAPEDALSQASSIAIRAKASLIAALGSRALERRGRQLGFRMNAALLGVYGFDADARRYLAMLSHWFASAPDAALMMCHPGRGDDSSDPIAAAREIELQVLAGSDFPELLARHRIRLMAMSDILRPMPSI